jgi:hypothetical protein
MAVTHQGVCESCGNDRELDTSNICQSCAEGRDREGGISWRY